MSSHGFHDDDDDDLFVANTHTRVPSVADQINAQSQMYSRNGSISFTSPHNNNPFANGYASPPAMMPQHYPMSPQYMGGPPGMSSPPSSYNVHKSASSYSTMVDEDKFGYNNSNEQKPSRTVAFQENEPAFPSSVYNGDHRDSYMDLGPYRPDAYGDSMDFHRRSQMMTFAGEDYMINTFQDAEGNDYDPFADDESLFSDDSDGVQRKNTTRSVKRGNTIKFNDIDQFYEVDEEDDYKPRLQYTRTIKRAKLVDGNFVIDAPVPKALLDTYGKKVTDSGREMSFMRYTAATCGPSNYVKYKFNLRQALYNPPRETEIMLVITMYNEDEILLARTLMGVFENVKNLTQRNDPTWGEESWKKIVVCIVSDGRVAFNERTQQLLTALGCFQEGYAKSKINENDVKSHIFEYTSTVGIEKVNDRVHLTTNSSPVQFVFCLKEKNSKKINSHRWAFQAFAPILNPRVIMLLDCGTKPSKDAFYYLWRSFHDTNVAGACGEMRTGLGPNRSLLINPLVASQNFEYKISNVLDKPMESVFGFITVLPGAFSAYRYDALLNVNGEGPLEKYFKGEFLHSGSVIEEDDDERELKEKNFEEAGIFTSNMYLAEDRILCFELVAKPGYNYILRYVNEAKAETDVPEKIEDFVLQRRRWLNGSLFAACYAIFHWTNIWKTDHSLFRKLLLQLQFYYQLIQILVSWFSIGSFFLVFRVLTANLGSKEIDFVVGKYLSVVCLWLYIGAVTCTFVLAFGNTPRGTKKFYLGIAVVFAILMAYMLFSAIYLAVRTVLNVLKETDHFEPLMLFTNSKFRDLVVSMVSTYILYFVASLMYGEPSFMFSSFVQYLLLSPSYVNILNIYSFCNIHDVSWGTRDVPQAKNLDVARSSSANKDDIITVLPGVEQEVNDIYLNTLDSLRTVPVQVEEVNKKKVKGDTYYALIRTITVLFWMFTNLILIAIVLEIGGVELFMKSETRYTSISANSEVFMGTILWIVAGMALYRFIGSFIFLVFKVFRPLKWKFRARKIINEKR